MTKWQPINTITHINSILNSKGLELVKNENVDNEAIVNFDYYILDFEGNVIQTFETLLDVINEYKEILYPSYEYDDMEEI